MKDHSPDQENSRDIKFDQILTDEVAELSESALVALHSMYKFHVRLALFSYKARDKRVQEVLLKTYFGPLFAQFYDLCDQCFGDHTKLGAPRF